MNRVWLLLLVAAILAEETRAQIAQHQIVVLAVDGLVSTALSDYFMPLTQPLAAMGCNTRRMRTADAVRSQDATWASVFYCADPSAFGDARVPRISDALQNSWLDLLEQEKGYSLALFSDSPRELRELLGRPVTRADFRSDEIGGAALHLAGDNAKRVVLLHMGELDDIGPASGYDSVNYRAYVACLDRAIHRQLAALWSLQPETTTVLLVSNHGGKDYDHGHFNTDTLQVPFALFGYGIPKRRCHVVSHATETAQIGPTLFQLFNYSDAVPEEWFMRPMLVPPFDDFCAATYSDFLAVPGDDALRAKECNVYRATRHASLSRAMWLSVVMGVLFIVLSAAF